MGHLTELPTEAVIMLLSYLRAVELGATAMANKSIFSADRLEKAVYELIQRNQPLTPAPAYKRRLSQAIITFSPSSLFIFEGLCILSALNQPQPLPGKGFWISSSWHANAKRYLESIISPDVEPRRKSSSPKKATKGRLRGSEGSSPHPCINADILCEHGEMSLNSRRRSIDSKAWAVLRKYFSGTDFKCSVATECGLCAESSAQALQRAEERKRDELSLRKKELAPPALVGLLERKSGVPDDAVCRPWAFLDDPSPSDELSPQALQALLGNPLLPVNPGTYFLIPRSWLRQWRRFVKDPSIGQLPALDCANLMCYGHGALVVPPHLEEYLVGIRKTLLGSLGTYEGEVVELVSIAEFKALQMINRGLTDFGVRCVVDGEAVSWNAPLCTKCDPFSPSTYAHCARDLVGGKTKISMPRYRQVALGLA